MMGSQSDFWTDVYFLVGSFLFTGFGAFAKNDWLAMLRYRDGTRPSPAMTRIILIRSGVIGLVISYYNWSHGY